MKDYVKNLHQLHVPSQLRRKTDQAVDESIRAYGMDPKKLLTAYRSVVQQLSWLGRGVMIAILYDVGRAQQATHKLKVSDLLAVNRLIQDTIAYADEGRAVLKLRSPGTDYFADGDFALSAVHDASFAGESEHGSQQGNVILFGPRKHLQADAPVMIVSWASTKIHRVCRSTLAAEACSASHAHDTLAFLRAALAEWLYGLVEAVDNALGQGPGRGFARLPLALGHDPQGRQSAHREADRP